MSHPTRGRARTGLKSWVGVAVASALMLVGCQSDAADGPADEGEAPSAPVEGGVLNVGVDVDIAGSFDVHVSGADATAYLLRGVFDSLVSQDADGEFHPWLAEDWEISDDGLQYTFDLREDVTFHNGEAFDAEAVKANFEHVKDPDTQSQYAANLLAGDAYESTEVLDQYTVQINLSRPYAPLLQSLSTAYLGFYPPEHLAANTDALAAGGPDVTLGSGPFRVSGNVAGQSVTLEKNPDYQWGPADAENTGPAYLDGVEFRILLENAVRSGALGSGEIHVADNVATTDIDLLQNDDAVTIGSVAAQGLPYSVFLNHSQGVFADQAVRQAFQRGVDISSATDAVFSGHYDRAWSILTPTSAGIYDESLEDSWPFDPDLANSVLDDAGWTERDADGYRTKDGQRLSAEWLFLGAREDRASFADAFQADLREIGFELVTVQEDIGAALERLYAGDYDAVDWSFVRSDGDILRLHLYSEFAPVQNASFVDDPQVDEWVLAASQSTDVDERAELYREVQNWAIETAAIVPVYVPTRYVASAPEVHGISADVAAWPRFHDAWIAER